MKFCYTSMLLLRYTQTSDVFSWHKNIKQASEGKSRGQGIKAIYIPNFSTTQSTHHQDQRVGGRVFSLRWLGALCTASLLTPPTEAEGDLCVFCVFFLGQSALKNTYAAFQTRCSSFNNSWEYTYCYMFLFKLPTSTLLCLYHIKHEP